MSSPSTADDFDRLRRRVLWSMPTGLYVVGSRAGERYNAMTLNLAMQVSMEPKQIAIAVIKDALTHELIETGRAFSLNILGRQDRTIVRKFVKPVEVDLENGTLAGFDFTEKTTGAPILTTSFAYLDCRLRQTVDCGDHSLFIGEVDDAGFLAAEEAEVLRMEDTRMNYGG
jgi:flavin reductase (DIM6/NTAB) family NADH-FMN oxidoreductase RutF